MQKGKVTQLLNGGAVIRTHVPMGSSAHMCKHHTALYVSHPRMQTVLRTVGRLHLVTHPHVRVLLAALTPRASVLIWFHLPEPFPCSLFVSVIHCH